MSLFGSGFLGSVIGGAGGAIGSALGAGGLALGSSALDFLGNKSLQDDAQQFSAYQAQNQIRWRVADLKAAGLNPILAAGNLGGASASSPGASMPSVAGAVSSAVQAKKMKTELDVLRADIKQKDSQKQKNMWDAAAAASMVNLNSARTANTKWDNMIKSLQIPEKVIEKDYYMSSEGKLLKRRTLGYGPGSNPVQTLTRGLMQNMPTKAGAKTQAERIFGQKPGDAKKGVMELWKRMFTRPKSTPKPKRGRNRKSRRRK